VGIDKGGYLGGVISENVRRGDWGIGV